MGFEDSVVVKMGLDRRSFDKALKGASSAMATFKGALGALGVNFSLGQLKGFISGVFGLADDLKRTSEALEISTDFLQDWRNAVAQSGGDANTAAKHIERFTQRLKDNGKTGSDVEQELRKVADQMAAQPDPVKRARIAFDAFGKGAAELIPLLSQGSKGLDEFRGRVKLTTKEIEALDKAQDDLDQTGRDLQVGGGKAAGWLIRMSRLAGELFVKLKATGMQVKGIGEIFDEIADDHAEQERLVRIAKEDEQAKKKQAIAAADLAEKEKVVADAYTEAMDAQAKADFDALDDAKKLNVLLEFRLKLLRDITNGGKASVENAKKFAAVARLGGDISDLKNKIGPGEIQPGTAIQSVANARSKALALQPAIQTELDRQARLQSMTARDRVLSLNSGLRDMDAKVRGIGGKTDVQETEKGVWRLVELAETTGVKIIPTNGE